MKITKTKDLPTYELTKSEFNDLILKDETNLSVDNINNYLVSKIKLWEVSLISVDEVNKSKAKLIYISQVLIGLCLFVLGLVTIVIALYY